MEIENLELKLKDDPLLDEDLETAELKNIVEDFHNVIKEQNEVIYKLKNDYIILRNNFEDTKNKLIESNAYKKLCNIMLNKINHNPISSLWFIYSIKRKIKEYEENFN